MIVITLQLVRKRNSKLIITNDFHHFHAVTSSGSEASAFVMILCLFVFVFIFLLLNDLSSYIRIQELRFEHVS